MADVFLSYRNLEDRRSLVTRFATILRAHEISVWWDYGLDAGESYREQITRELSSAKLVIPFWCEESVASNWVRMEAELGKDKLFPARLQRVTPPSAFEQIHAAHLEAWNGSILDPKLDEFVRDICERLGKPSRLPADTKSELASLPRLKPLGAPRVRQTGGLAPPLKTETGPPRHWLIGGTALALVAISGAVIVADPLSWRVAPSLPDVAQADTEEATPELTIAPAPSNNDAQPGATAKCRPPVPATVFFDRDTAVLPAEAITVLDLLVSQVIESGCTLGAMRVEGHDDTSNTAPDAAVLSERRAQTVAQALTAAGIDGRLIETVGYGSRRLAEQTGPGVREPLNRRVEISTAYANGEAQGAAPAQSIARPMSSYFVAQLGVFRSAADAAESWSDAQSRSTQSFAHLVRTIEPIESGGRVVHRLSAVGFGSLGEAKAWCETLKSTGVACVALQR